MWICLPVCQSVACVLLLGQCEREHSLACINKRPCPTVSRGGVLSKCGREGRGRRAGREGRQADGEGVQLDRGKVQAGRQGCGEGVGGRKRSRDGMPIGRQGSRDEAQTSRQAGGARGLPPPPSTPHLHCLPPRLWLGIGGIIIDCS